MSQACVSSIFRDSGSLSLSLNHWEDKAGRLKETPMVVMWRHLPMHLTRLSVKLRNVPTLRNCALPHCPIFQREVGIVWNWAPFARSGDNVMGCSTEGAMLITLSREPLARQSVQVQKGCPFPLCVSLERPRSSPLLEYCNMLGSLCLHASHTMAFLWPKLDRDICSIFCSPLMIMLRWSKSLAYTSVPQEGSA